jgi:polyhydroxyalkanoate synthesis regulator phasin
MPLYKILDGIRIELTPEEEAKFLAQQAIDAAKPRPTEFEQKIQDPMIRSIVQELAVALAQTEQEVTARLKTRFEDIQRS